MIRSLGITVLLFGLASSARADVVAGWTFETSQPTTAGPVAAEVGSGTASGVHASTSAVYSSPVGNGSAHSYSSNFWAVGDYYQFSFNSTGFTGLSFSFDQTSSATGPANFKVQVSTDGTNFTDLAGGSYTVLPNAANTAGTVSFWSSTGARQSAYTFNFSSLPSNLSAIRLVDTSTNQAGGGTSPVGTAGTDRVDNVFVMGTAASAVPEPSTLALTGLAVVGFAARSLRRRSA